ncbi:uncharacterized protein LOC127866978 isoform X2 [Dreissena polymorpha]|uniref:uncharacterized protein LOC127866978 isoform X2 n=1 Tax=Dreissena polymorpha TaxID=45954 RepID=UPI0022640E6E|nr:uncharacterized protein LOC127866978 isoform X2 [Dreissena polymorpha]XP_052263836.1 uncharacterized protein LOC127866978 isoform X2 [Dreissena polymorpha]
MAEGAVRHYTEWTPRLIRRSRYAYEHESRETSNIMNILGYGPEIRQKRREHFIERDRLLNTRREDFSCTSITAGSKAEGLTRLFESDNDTILVLPYVVCLENCFDQSNIPCHFTILEMNFQNTSAGYCRVLLERLAPVGVSAISDSLCENERGKPILSSSLFVEAEFRDASRVSGTVIHQRAGPSLPWSNGAYKADSVYAIRCHCPNILQTWANRTRHWPPSDIVEKVVAMGAFVTPIGFKRSEHNHVEWRICFNTGETELVNNLNDTQIKLYMLLKMIAKDILKPQKKEITSYTMKNIVLWLAENNKSSLFHSGSLFYWLHEGLDILRTAISTRQLPYYMIPKRNLMATSELNNEQQLLWGRTIQDMIEEGPRILLRLDKFRKAVIGYPEPLLWYSKMRTELEMWQLKLFNRQLQCEVTNSMVFETDTIVQTFKKRTNEILQEVAWRMVLDGSSLDVEVFEMMLS